MVLGLRGTWVEACKVVGMTSLLAAPVLLPSCGSSTRSDETPNGNAGRGSGGSSAAGGSSGSGGSSAGSPGAGSAGRSGTGGAAGSNATGGKGGTGGAGSGGAGMAGASGASAGMSASGSGGQSGDAGSSGSGSAGEGGEGAVGGMGPGPVPGFDCNAERCDAGERCTFCNQGEGTFGKCTPDPEDDPTGYQTATAGCIDLDPNGYFDCDGPEDCASGEYCAWGLNPGVARVTCVPEAALPDPPPTFCCFSCGSLPECVLCWSNDDCPDPYECVREDALGVGGCQPPD